MTSLPRQVPHGLRNLPRVVSAYDVCLRLEDSLQLAVDDDGNVWNSLIYVRILGYLIHYVPTDLGLETVVQEISSSVDDAALLSVGRFYYDNFIRAFRANKRHTPTPSSHASHRSFDTIQDMIKATLKEAPQSHAQAKDNALIRDGYRCVVTGKYDISSVKTIRELAERLESQTDVGITPTQCAHIFSESTNYSIEPGSAKREYAATMWAVMVRFGYTELPMELNGSKVHRLENVMTLDPSFHILFDQLDVWFLAKEGEKNTYRLAASNPLILTCYPEFVTFKTPDANKFPLPSPTYLAIHAACAQVAHLSGAAERIDRLYRDMEDGSTLDTNGTSAATLEHAIFELQVAGYGA